MKMSIVEIIIMLIIGIPVFIGLALLLGSAIKENADPKNKTGTFGWIIALLIAAALIILYASLGD